MTEIFITVLGMSITASFVVAAVFLLRLLLKGAPRVFSYVLWIVVFARLLCPYFPESDWGIIPDTNLSKFLGSADLEQAKDNLQMRDRNSAEGLPPAENGTGAWKDMEKNSFDESERLSDTEKERMENETGIWGVNVKEAAGNFRDGQAVIQRLTAIWLAGCISLLLYGAVSYLQFMRNLKLCEKEAEGKEREKDNTDKRYPVITSKNASAPFVAGFFRPVIYLPERLDKMQAGMVYEHEKMHIARRDYLIKPVAYLALCIHWFNPFVWLAFHLMEKDMEISCDEAVIGKIGYEKNKDYARTLLHLSSEHSWKPGCPIAFGENSVKARIKNVVRCRHAKTWIVIVSAVVVLGAAVLFFVNSRWNLVISLEEKGTVQSGAEDVTIQSVQGVPGTDSNSSGDEIIYLPEERIAHVENIPENEAANTTDHYYFVTSQPLERAEEPDDEQAGAQKNEEENRGQIPDIYAVLLRQAGEASDDSTVSYAYPLAAGDDDIIVTYTYPLAYERISDDYGTRIHPVTKMELIHSGIDFAADKGTPVKAAASGVVFETGTDTACGNYVIIQHSNGDMTYYANCDEVLAEAGQEVEAGEQIATVGNTGYSTGAHLHYAVSRNGEYVRPEFF